MASENETVMAVCAEWRDCIEAADPSVWNDERIAGLVKTTKEQQLAYLDRIDAAWRRDEERAVEHATRHAEAVARDNCRDCIHNPNGKNYEGVGNAAAMREALNDIVWIAKIALNVNCVGNGNDSELWNIIDKCKSALSAPPRQCDVGTPEEQSDRFANFCDSHSACSQCPVKSRWNFANGHKPSCGVLWAQMPYESKKGGAE